VSDTKMGRIPMASKATKKGIKGRKTLKDMIDLKNKTHSIPTLPHNLKIISPFFLSNPMEEKSSNSLRLTLKFKSDTKIER
jgi:hypothetical protein